MPQLGLIAIMASMAKDVSPISGAGGAGELARFLNDYHDCLSDEQAVDILTLGARLWRRSIELEDAPPEIGAQLAQRH
jgi:hypothetical protein